MPRSICIALYCFLAHLTAWNAFWHIKETFLSMMLLSLNRFLNFLNYTNRLKNLKDSCSKGCMTVTIGFKLKALNLERVTCSNPEERHGVFESFIIIFFISLLYVLMMLFCGSDDTNQQSEVSAALFPLPFLFIHSMNEHCNFV